MRKNRMKPGTLIILLVVLLAGCGKKETALPRALEQ